MGFDLFVKIVGVVSATLAIGTTILRIASRNFGYSPKRRKYWIARLESSVEEYDKTGGQQGFDDRIVDVRCQAEGFEAARSMGVDSRIVNWGIGTVLIVAAILLAFFWSGWDPASVTASNSEGGGGVDPPEKYYLLGNDGIFGNPWNCLFRMGADGQ